ncbi:hypothetical protein D3C72_1325120 [compost metagenome]
MHGRELPRPPHKADQGESLQGVAVQQVLLVVLRMRHGTVFGQPVVVAHQVGKGIAQRGRLRQGIRRRQACRGGNEAAQSVQAGGRIGHRGSPDVGAVVGAIPDEKSSIHHSGCLRTPRPALRSLRHAKPCLTASGLGAQRMHCLQGLKWKTRITIFPRHCWMRCAARSVSWFSQAPACRPKAASPPFATP